MSSLSWNCRGLGCSRTVQELKDLVSNLKPSFVFLMELKVDRAYIEKVRIQLGFEGAFYVDRVGLSGGLSLFWKSKEMASLISFSRYHIDVIARVEGKPEWRLTGYYGQPDRSRRHESWALLRSLKSKSQLPWCILGDFNDILFQSEKRGNTSHPNYLLNGFRSAVEDANLIDLGMSGYEFTWERGAGSDDWVEERLDRVMASNDWINLNAGAVVRNILTLNSDHSALSLQLSSINEIGIFRFRFENAWAKEPDCRDTIATFWADSATMDLSDRLKECSEGLDSWGKKIRTKFKNQMRKLRTELNNLMGLRDAGSVARLKVVRSELGKLYDQQNSYWKQRAKQFWLESGDSNSRFFHQCANGRRRKNNISKLKDNQGVWREWDSGLEDTIKNYFIDLFGSKGSECEAVLNFVKPKVTEAHNQALLLPFVAEEVKDALFSMHPDKSPGPDGFNPGFYQKFWDITGPKVTEACLHYLNSSFFPAELNATSVVLIPKVKKPEVMSELRPIALCNVIFKIMSKMLANRLKSILPDVISDTQSAFIPNRLITDNVMVAYEIGHYLRRRRQGKIGFAALKLDMSKAYDRIEWGFLRAMLVKLGFDLRWVELIMRCVSTVSYTVVHNNREVGPIVPQRGLRQGDPISPYLFILCAEGFSNLLQGYVDLGHLHGCKVAQTAPSVSHLFFADDSFIFFRATEQECYRLKECLDLYEKASGQKINFQKSSITFSSSVNEDTRSLVCDFLQVQETSNNGKYLGLPSLVGRNKSQIFSYVKDKVWSRIQGWKKKSLSRAGKEILLKTVAQAIPSYVMSVFVIPRGLCAEIERLMNSFWWGSGANRGIHWFSWERLSIPKKNGGLGFRRLYDYNIAMVAKQGWRLLKHPDSLMARVLKARYFPHGNFISAKLGVNPSYIWSSVIASQPLVKKKARLRVGTGVNINVFSDPWLPDPHNPYVESVPDFGLEDLSVSSLRVSLTEGWDTAIIADLFSARDRNLIQKIPLSSQPREDCWYWDGDPQGRYSVKEGYKAWCSVNAQPIPNASEVRWSHLWGLNVPAKVRLFLWRICSDSLPLNPVLAARHVEVNALCPVCNLEQETSLHALVSCQFAIAVWATSCIGIFSPAAGTFLAWWNAVCNKFKADDVCVVAMTLWAIWNNRNDWVWNGKHAPAVRVIGSALNLLSQWTVAQKSFRKTSSNPVAEGDFKWVRPVAGTVKCNIDGSVFEAQGKVGFGFVIRNDLGHFLHARNGSISAPLDPLLAEAISCREALSWIKDAGLSNVCVEADSLILILALRGDFSDSSYIGSVIQDCKILAQDILGVNFRFVFRSANQVAHCLARASASLSDSGYWEDVPPRFIFDVLAIDLI